MAQATTIKIHRVEQIQFDLVNGNTCWLEAGDMTIFFSTAGEAQRWLTGGLKAIADADIPAAYDDRNDD